MNEILAAASSEGWVDLLVKFGIAAIVIGALWAILQYFGVTIHPVVRIILIAVFSIIVLVVMVKLLYMFL